MGSDDWLDTPPAQAAQPLALTVPITLPDDYRARVELAEACWTRLSAKQKIFLQAWRDCRFNARAAARQIGQGQNTYIPWLRNPDYATVVRVWTANAAANALDRDRLLARQDDIVETLLTPKPILHQGIPVLDTRIGAQPGAVLEECEAGAASRANEVLLQAAGVIKTGKDTEINVNVGIVGPALSIQVMPMPPSQNVQSRAVSIDLAEPAIEAEFVEVDEDWLDA